MYYIVEYLFSLFIKSENGDDLIIKNIDEEPFQIVLSSKEINSVILKPVVLNKNKYKYEKVDLRNLNLSQQKEIINVKLKPVKKNVSDPKKYETRHPVLKELLSKTQEIQ